MFAKYTVSGETTQWQNCFMSSFRQDAAELYPYHAGR